MRLKTLFELAVRRGFGFVAETVNVEGVEQKQQSTNDDSDCGRRTEFDVDYEGEDELLNADQRRRELPLSQGRGGVSLKGRASLQLFED